MSRQGDAPRRGLDLSLGAIIVAALLIVQLGMAMVWAHERFMERVQSLADATVERVVSLRDLIAEAPPGDRERLMRGLSDASLRLQLAAAPDAAGRSEWRHATRIRGEIDFDGLPADAQVGFVEVPGAMHRRDGTVALLLSLPLTEPPSLASESAEPQWLNVEYRVDPRAAGSELRVLSWALLLTLGVTALAFVALRRATRPLRTLAEAAQRFGDDPHAPALAERGGRETVLAIRAFNTMQARLARLLDDRTRMLGALSHDLRTQLTRLGLRLEGIDDAEQSRLARIEMDTMTSMVEGALAFARDDAADEAPRDLDLAVLLSTLTDERSDLGEDVAYVGPAHLRMQGRPLALRRAFDNLIGNAVRYGSGARITLSEADESDDDDIIVRIADRGAGIPEDARARVLEPFVRLDPSRSLAHGGAGLGLAIASSAIALHGGSLAFEEREDDPWRFCVRVRLPTRLLSASAPGTRGDAAPAHGRPSNGSS